jgi:tRNA(Ile)-lysidine synthase
MNKRKDLLQKFIEFNAAKRLASAKKKTLLAVSGGRDSVVMCHLFHQARFPFAIAHCNFQLRGEESDGDEQLVKQLAEKLGVECFVKRFDTKKYAKAKGFSTQLAARELRYEWFNELLSEKNLKLIATAHQLNDNIETILFNLVKGTGTKGLRGIPVRRDNIIRPLLFAPREEIEAYQQEHDLEFREDSSNAEDKYTRNKIRHQVIPLLKEINPSLEETFADKIDLFQQLELIYEKEVSRSMRQLFLQRGNDIYIPLLKLSKTKNAKSVLFEHLKDYGFNAQQVDDMLAGINADAGKQFLSDKARIIKDRRFFILTKLTDVSSSMQLIEPGSALVQLDRNKLTVTDHKSEVRNSKSEIQRDKNFAFLDKDKLEFPLIARKWKAGDYFYPFGMKMKKKKLKKFFTDEKIPLQEKEKIWIIESNKKIVWVAGYRIDERFKVTEKTKEVLRLQLS